MRQDLGLEAPDQVAAVAPGGFLGGEELPGALFVVDHGLRGGERLVELRRGEGGGVEDGAGAEIAGHVDEGGPVLEVHDLERGAEHAGEVGEVGVGRDHFDAELDARLGELGGEQLGRGDQPGQDVGGDDVELGDAGLLEELAGAVDVARALGEPVVVAVKAEADQIIADVALPEQGGVDQLLAVGGEADGLADAGGR